jgi:redox-sensitive bicupin YhaK (pirin superfamily)
MQNIRRAAERGHANHGWLDSYHTFSFADYFDPEHVSFGSLRVINEDRVQPGKGFGTHGHKDMEIISYVLEGALSHQDSMGTGSVIRPGDVQRMSAGTGVMHSEFNPSSAEPAHFLQIWIVPKFTGIRPSYEQKFFSAEEKRGRLRVIASPDGRDDSVTIHQDALLYSTLLDGAEQAAHTLAPGRRAYVHVARGKVTANDQPLSAGDALQVTGETHIILQKGENAEVLLFDLA